MKLTKTTLVIALSILGLWGLTKLFPLLLAIALLFLVSKFDREGDFFDADGGDSDGDGD